MGPNTGSMHGENEQSSIVCSSSISGRRQQPASGGVVHVTVPPVLASQVGGAVQAGIGIPLLLALVGAGGLDLVRANSVKVALIAALTAVALGQFIWAGKVVWLYGLVLAVGSGLGGYVASRAGARVGERLIRPVLAVTVILLALRLLVGG